MCIVATLEFSIYFAQEISDRNIEVIAPNSATELFMVMILHFILFSS